MPKNRRSIPAPHLRPQNAEPSQMLKAQATFSPMESALQALINGEETFVGDDDQVLYQHRPGVHYPLFEGLRAVCAFVEIYDMRRKVHHNTATLARVALALRNQEVLTEVDLRIALEQLQLTQRLMSRVSMKEVISINNALRIRNAMEEKAFHKDKH